MKKIITNFLLLIFCSIPRLIKAQIGTDKVTVTNEEKLNHPKFIENISFIPAGNLPSPAYTEMEPLARSEFNAVLRSDKVLVKEDVEKEEIEKVSLQQVKYAMRLDVAVETIKNTTLYKFVESWYGTRYRMGGTTKKGIDCSAFTDSLIYQVYDLLIPRTAREQYKFCERINKEDLLEGDLVFFNTHKGVSHVGVYLANGRFVHSSKTQGVMISSLSENYFSRRYIGAGRVPE